MTYILPVQLGIFYLRSTAILGIFYLCSTDILGIWQGAPALAQRTRAGRSALTSRQVAGKATCQLHFFSFGHLSFGWSCIECGYYWGFSFFSFLSFTPTLGCSHLRPAQPPPHWPAAPCAAPSPAARPAARAGSPGCCGCAPATRGQQEEVQ